MTSSTAVAVTELIAIIYRGDLDFYLKGINDEIEESKLPPHLRPRTLWDAGTLSSPLRRAVVELLNMIRSDAVPHLALIQEIVQSRARVAGIVLEVEP